MPEQALLPSSPGQGRGVHFGAVDPLVDPMYRPLM